jgi:c-di-GMP phosphodiesterase
VAVADDRELASARVALGALTEIGLERIVGPRRAWINVTREFLVQGLADSLPPERVVLELVEDQLVDQPLVDAIAQLRDSGYVLALDDFSYTPGLEVLLELAQYVKLDLLALGPRRTASEADRLRRYGLTLVAEKIETHESFREGIAAGCDLFQGYFFCRPQLLTDRAITPSRVALLELALALQDPDIELADLDRLISTDVALSYRLLRYINSAYFSLGQQVASIMHAVVLLGIESVRRWVTLTIFAEIGDNKPPELFLTGLIRGRFCERAGRTQDGSPAELFTLGLFSVLDALTDTPMRTIVESLPFPPHMRDALIDHTGAGWLLECIQSIERGDFLGAHRLLRNPTRHYLDSIAWADDTAKHLFPTNTDPH